MTTIWPFSTVTRRTVLMKRSTLMPALVSMMSRGPASGWAVVAVSGCDAGGALSVRDGAGRARPRRVGRRVRAVLGGVGFAGGSVVVGVGAAGSVVVVVGSGVLVATGVSGSRAVVSVAG